MVYLEVYGWVEVGFNIPLMWVAIIVTLLITHFKNYP